MDKESLESLGREIIERDPMIKVVPLVVDFARVVVPGDYNPIFDLIK
jgi:hypothetical protein